MDTFKKTIWVSKKSAFEDKVKHLNRLLKKQGKSPITFSYENHRPVKVEFTYHNKGDAFKNDITKTRFVEICDVVCSGVLEVKKDDIPYTYIGSVSVMDGIRQVFCKDEKYANYFMDGFKEGWCDHCKSKRMNRKSYHLFATDKGEVIQIGSTCAKEYFGIDSVAFLETYGKTFFVSYEGCLDDVDLFKESRIYTYEEVVPLLDYATQGFLKWNKKGCSFPELPVWENPTVQGVRDLLDQSLLDRVDGQTTVVRKFNAVSADLTLEECLAYWQAKADQEKNSGSPFATVSTFTFNVIETLKAGYANGRSLGSFCYGVFAAYNDKVKRLQDAAIGKEVVPCRFAKGIRADIKGIIVNVREWEDENPYSFRGEDITKYTVDFKDEVGTLYHFTTSSETFAEVENGMEVSIRGKVEDTKEYKGMPYTRLSRPVCTILDKKVA